MSIDGKGTKAPKEGTKQWKQNEITINNKGLLKRARDISEGVEKPKHRYSDAGGKGCAPRPGSHSQQYKDNFDIIFGNKKKKPGTKRGYRLKVNGVYVDDDNDTKLDPGTDPYDNDEYSRSHDED